MSSDPIITAKNPVPAKRYEEPGFDAKALLAENNGDRIATFLQGFERVKLPEIIAKHKKDNNPETLERLTNFAKDYARAYVELLEFKKKYNIHSWDIENHWSDQQNLFYLRLRASGPFSFLPPKKDSPPYSVSENEFLDLDHNSAKDILASLICRTRHCAEAIYGEYIATSLTATGIWQRMGQTQPFSGFIRQ